MKTNRINTARNLGFGAALILTLGLAGPSQADELAGNGGAASDDGQSLPVCYFDGPAANTNIGGVADAPSTGDGSNAGSFGENPELPGIGDGAADPNGFGKNPELPGIGDGDAADSNGFGQDPGLPGIGDGSPSEQNGAGVGGFEGAPSIGDHLCAFDLNDDNVVDIKDLVQLMQAWGHPCVCPADGNEDGIVDAMDVVELMAEWGNCG